MLLKAFHFSLFLLNTLTIIYDQLYVDLPFPTKQIEAFPLKARYMFLTIWCLVFQALYFFVSFLNDVYGTNSPSPKKTPSIRKTKDTMFSIAFTLAIYVSTAFWGIYAIDKELIFPTEISSKVPVWMNHVMHTLIGPFILIELLASNVKYPRRKLGFGLVVALNVSYIIMIIAVYFVTNVWVYPFIEHLNWPLRCVFFSTSTLIGYFVYILGEYLNKLVSCKVSVHSNGTTNGVKKTIKYT